MTLWPSHSTLDDSRDSEGADGLRCRQPRVISPEQKRWTQLDVTSEDASGRQEVSRQRLGQQTIHGEFKRTPLAPPPKPSLAQRRKTDILSSSKAPTVNGKVASPVTRHRTSRGSNREKRDENVRNSVLALVSAFENGNSSVNAVLERQSQMMTVPECAQIGQTSQEQHRHTRVRRKSDSKPTAFDSSAAGLNPPALQKRVSRSMNSLVQEFEDVAFEMTKDNGRTTSEVPETSSSFEVPDKPQRTFEQDIYNQSKLQQANQSAEEEGRRKLSISRIGQPQQDFEENAPEKRKALQPKQRPPSADVTKKSKEQEQLSRTLSDEKDSIMFGYDHAGNFLPENNCSRNCNHNVESEENQGLNILPQYDQDREFFASSPKLKNCYETVVVENNNQTSFLDVLKSPMSRRPKLSSPPPTPTVVVITKPPTAPPPMPPNPHPQLTSPSPTNQKNSAKPNGFVNGNITQENPRKLLPAPPDLTGNISPETQRRLTDSALSLSPRNRRRDGMSSRGAILPGVYAEPIHIKRSVSAENLSTMRPAPIVDGQGYSVPGSHLWSPKASTMKPKVRSRYLSFFHLKLYTCRWWKRSITFTLVQWW